MIQRDSYIRAIEPLLDKPVVKVLTGMRRSGKSFLLRLLMEELGRRGVPPQNLLYLNFESMEHAALSEAKALYAHVKAASAGVCGRVYLLLDEIQEVSEWERAVASWNGEGGAKDVIITGSNANLFSSELATLLTGRHVEIPVYPLGFREFLRFRGFGQPPGGDERQRQFDEFLRYGGLPGIHEFGQLREETVFPVLSSILDSILLKDIVRRHQVRNVRLLQAVGHYLFDNLGNLTTAANLAAYLKSQHQPVSVDTVLAYLRHFVDAGLAAKAVRFDLKGKRVLEVNEKYYVSDLGLRHAWLGFRPDDIGGLLENVVYMELRRRGFQVSVGKLGEREVDFVAVRHGQPLYLQVAYLLPSPEAVQRECAPLLAIPDQYPKLLLTLDRLPPGDIQGIPRLNLIDWLLDDGSP